MYKSNQIYTGIYGAFCSKDRERQETPQQKHSLLQGHITI